MSSSLNVLMIIGNLGKEPDYRFTPDGTPTCKFSVAVSRDWKNAKGERCSETQWFNVVTWRALATNCSQYCYKGQKVYCSGRLQTRTWTNPQGVEKLIVELVANEIKFLSPPKASLAGPATAPDGEPATAADDDEEITF